MDAGWQAFWFGLALALFALEAILTGFVVAHPRFNLIAAGLACFAVPFFWIALQAA